MGRTRLILWLILATACTGTAVQPSASASTTVAVGEPSPVAAASTILVITHTTGFRHSSIPTAEATIAALGAQSNLFTVRHCRDAADVAKMTTSTALKDVQAVFFANTTGDLGLPDLDGFFAWVRAGGGVLGAHSASDTYHNEPRYIDMLGGEFLTHGNQATVTLVTASGTHPATSGLPARFQMLDEIYHLKDNNRGRVDTLLSLDRAPDDGLPGANQPADMPISWAKRYGAGRVFYTALGHREDVWEDARFRAHVLGGIKWVLAGTTGTTGTRNLRLANFR